MSFVTFAGTIVDGALTVVSLNDVDQTTPNGTPAAASGSSTTPSSTASSASGELVLDAIGAFFPAASAAVGASQTERVKVTGWEGSDAVNAQSSEAGAASVTMDWTLGSSAPWSSVAVPWKPVSGAPTGALLKMMRRYL